jgi:trehalose 6-phosphate synthase/phosphatase
VNYDEKYLDEKESAFISDLFSNSLKRLILLDYDGTLVPFNCDPAKALPSESLINILKNLTSCKNLDLVIISGRHRSFLEDIFGDLDVTIFAEHGAIYRINGIWDALENDLSWQDEVIGIIGDFVKSTPGSSLEKKENSLVWHYRKADSQIAGERVGDLIDRLTPISDANNLTIMKGRKIVEIKPSDYTKGTAIVNFYDCSRYDFILAAGDDVTDEDLFEALPSNAIIMHIGKYSPLSTYTLRNSEDFVAFLGRLTQRHENI